MPLSISSTEASARAFFAKPYFAVVGASTNQAKFGYKSKVFLSSACDDVFTYFAS
jgi:hypothetical protein